METGNWFGFYLYKKRALAAQLTRRLGSRPPLPDQAVKEMDVTRGPCERALGWISKRRPLVKRPVAGSTRKEFMYPCEIHHIHAVID